MLSEEFSLEEYGRALGTYWKQEGKREGIQEGIQKGKREGIQEGIQEGKREGIQEGKREGAEENRLETVLRMRDLGCDMSLIAAVTGLSEDAILRLR
ncbi:MAG: hypothetical protein LBS11_02715 [Oscillospiraceae bacterium]|jgi:flagellar biosynthesis/type III secretory pathway protein FliH|nr:hypothetical protein [Oscillospiraceae bacterium]